MSPDVAFYDRHQRLKTITTQPVYAAPQGAPGDVSRVCPQASYITVSTDSCTEEKSVQLSEAPRSRALCPCWLLILDPLLELEFLWLFFYIQQCQYVKGAIARNKSDIVLYLQRRLVHLEWEALKFKNSNT